MIFFYIVGFFKFKMLTKISGITCIIEPYSSSYSLTNATGRNKIIYPQKIILYHDEQMLGLHFFGDLVVCHLY